MSPASGLIGWEGSYLHLLSAHLLPRLGRELPLRVNVPAGIAKADTGGKRVSTLLNQMTLPTDPADDAEF